MTEKYAVFGNPIAHSKSPDIHQRFADQFGKLIDYRKILVEPGDFASAIDDFFNGGGVGCNVTVPFKQEAHDLCDELSPAAARACAVNTLYRDSNDRLCGHNSDGPGLVNDLVNNQSLVLEGCDIVILGAGGAARGILEPLIGCAPSSISVINRNTRRALTMAADFSDLYPIATPDGSLLSETPALLINATSASLDNNLPAATSNARLAGPGTTCYDLAYGSEPTAFMRWAGERGAARAIDGRGMLIEQAAVSFALWTRLTPDTRPVLDWLASR